MARKTVLALAGSPVKGGSTDTLLDQVLRGAMEKGASVEKIYVCDLKIKPCDACGDCDETGVCTIEDDMKVLYKKLLKSDVVILASPIYFMGLTAQMKSVIDRCQSLWVGRFKLKRKLGKGGRRGFFISVGGKPHPQLFQGAVATVKSFFKAIGVNYTDDLLFSKIDKKQDLLAHPTAMKAAFKAGGKLANE
ncbi:MAG: flavodoxin family protein [Candidatus Hadarchaeota archaeon]